MARAAPSDGATIGRVAALVAIVAGNGRGDVVERPSRDARASPSVSALYSPRSMRTTSATLVMVAAETVPIGLISRRVEIVRSCSPMT